MKVNTHMKYTEIIEHLGSEALTGILIQKNMYKTVRSLTRDAK